jgi:DNA (cytosine-5)-methyltransferase 1
VGFREFEDYFNFRFPQPISLNGSKVKLKQVIDSQADKDDKWFFSQKAVDGMLRVREKMNKGRVQDLEQPCNTISSHLAKVSLNGTDPVLMVDGKYRRFTPREAANIQSFPESFKLDIVSENRQYRAIGNAVPPVLMWHVANALVNYCTVENQKEIKENREKLVNIELCQQPQS